MGRASEQDIFGVESYKAIEEEADARFCEEVLNCEREREREREREMSGLREEEIRKYFID